MQKYVQKTKGRKKLVTNYTLTGNEKDDSKTIPKIIAEVWPDFTQNVTDSQKLYNYFYNDTLIREKVKTQRPDINNMLAIPRAFEIQRKINSYANGNPREYSALSSDKEKLLEIFNNYQLDECKHSKTQLTNYYASICGVGYYCVLPDYYSGEVSPYEIYSENFTPFNTFMVYENSLKGEELMGVNFFEKKDDKGITTTVFNVFTKTHQFIFESTDKTDPTTYVLTPQNFFNQATKQLEKVDAIRNVLGIIPIIEVDYHPFRMGIFEIVLDLIDCVNMFLSGDVDAMQQAIDYVLVMTDCEFEQEYDENGKPIPRDINSRRLIQIKTNGAATQAKVEILTNNVTNDNSIEFINLVNGLIEKIVGIPTRKNQDIGGNSSTGLGAKNENGMRDLDDNADIIQAEALLSERKFIKLVLAIDEHSPKHELAGLDASDIKVSFPRNEKENILVSAQAFSLLFDKMADVDALKYSNMTTDLTGTADRMKKAREDRNKEEMDKEKQMSSFKQPKDDGIQVTPPTGDGTPNPTKKAKD